jgi:signal transduction histidine kinase
VLAVAFSPRVFTKFMEGLPEYWLAGIVDRQGNYISRSLDNDVIVGRPASPGWRAIMHQRGIFEFPSREGENILNANAPSQLTGWASAVAVQSAALYKPLWRTLAVVATVGALAIAACLVLVAILARWIKTAMAHLKGAIAELRCRQPIIERMGEPEIDEVIEALNTTASELAAHERLRVEHERQMQTAAAELNHRSKNLLMVVSGIAAVIGRSAPDVRTFSERLTDRLQAPARCQDLLVWQEVDLVGVAKSQLATLCRRSHRTTRPGCCAARQSHPATQSHFLWARHQRVEAWIATNAFWQG